MSVYFNNIVMVNIILSYCFDNIKNYVFWKKRYLLFIMYYTTYILLKKFNEMKDGTENICFYVIGDTFNYGDVLKLYDEGNNRFILINSVILIMKT